MTINERMAAAGVPGLPPNNLRRSEMELSLLPCPFCGKPAEASHTMRATIEETMEAEPYINCSQPKCAGRHVCASVSEWQYRTDRIAELEQQLAAAQERNTVLQSEHLDHVIALHDQLTAANAEIERLNAELAPLGLPAPFTAKEE